MENLVYCQSIHFNLIQFDLMQKPPNNCKKAFELNFDTVTQEQHSSGVQSNKKKKNGLAESCVNEMKTKGQISVW